MSSHRGTEIVLAEKKHSVSKLEDEAAGKKKFSQKEMMKQKRRAQ